jgi:hypothetical protein
MWKGTIDMGTKSRTKSKDLVTAAVGVHRFALKKPRAELVLSKETSK